MEMRWAYENEPALQQRASEAAGPLPAPPRTLCANGCGHPVVPSSDAHPHPSEFNPGPARTCAFYHSHWEDGVCVYSSTVCTDEKNEHGWPVGPAAACSDEDRQKWVEWYTACGQRSSRYWTTLKDLCGALNGRRGAAFLAWRDGLPEQTWTREQRAQWDQWWETTGKPVAITELLATTEIGA